MKNKNFEKELIALYQKGLTDKEIGKILSVKECTIYWWRHKKLQLKANKKVNLEKHRTYIVNSIHSKIPIKNICEKIHCTPFSLRNYLKTIGFADLKHLKNNIYKIGPREKAILIGTLMGDATMSKRINNRYPNIVIRHSLKQKLYTHYLYSNLLSLKPRLRVLKLKKHVYNDKLFKESYQIELKLPSNKYYIELRDKFYINDKKVIPFDLLVKYYNREALAVHFMDDGSKCTDYKENISGFIISTNSFTIKEVEQFSWFLYSKFQLKNSILKSSNSIRISKESVTRFIYLVKPYITNDLMYKICPNKTS